MDHIGGLGNLLWNIRKLTVVEKRKTLAEKISVFVPYHESYQAVMDLLAHTEDDFVCNYEHEGCSVQDGLLYQGGADEDEIRVLALHNHHLKHEEGTPWRSFSFQIEVMGRKIFYSGDTEREDLADTVPDDCDLLMIETGHHQIVYPPWSKNSAEPRVGKERTKKSVGGGCADYRGQDDFDIVEISTGAKFFTAPVLVSGYKHCPLLLITF